MALALIGLGTSTGVASASGGAAAPSTPVSVTVSGTPSGSPVASGFLGMAFEYRTVPWFMGSDPHNPDSVLAQLIRTLNPGQAPSIRIGGESTDRTWWPVPHMREPLGVTDSLGTSWLAATRTLVATTGAKLILGINLEANRWKVTQTEALALVSGVGSQAISALEIGNEPELYSVVPWYEVDHGTIVPWYHKRHGTPVLARRKGYNFRIFQGEFTRFRKVLPKVPVAGPSTGNYQWLIRLPGFIGGESPLSMITFHRYGLNGCVQDRSSPAYPSVPNLLAPYASRGIMSGVGTYVGIAHRHGIPFRIDEMNSVTCGGRRGVSDTFASALWVLDALFEMASSGVDGINIHTFPGSANGLFDFNNAGGHWTGTVHPEYYGLQLFAEAAPAGARILPVKASNQPDLREWATLTTDHKIHVVLVNDSLTSPHVAAIQGPVHSGTGTVVRLSAPSPYATSGVTLGGQSYGNTTTSGLLSGGSQASSVSANSGTYSVTLPAASAAMITWNAG